MKNSKPPKRPRERPWKLAASNVPPKSLWPRRTNAVVSRSVSAYPIVLSVFQWKYYSIKVIPCKERHRAYRFKTKKRPNAWKYKKTTERLRRNLQIIFLFMFIFHNLQIFPLRFLTDLSNMVYWIYKSSRIRNPPDNDMPKRQCRVFLELQSAVHLAKIKRCA